MSLPSFPSGSIFFFKNNLLANVLHSKCSHSLSQASLGLSHDVTRYNWGVLIAIMSVENAFWDFLRKSACVAVVASSASTSEPSTYPQSPFANSKWRIWNFHVIQLDAFSLSIDHFSSTDSAIARKLHRYK